MKGTNTHNAYLQPILYSSIIGIVVLILGVILGYTRNQVKEETEQVETREVLEIIAQNMQYVIREINSVALLIAQTVNENGEVINFERTSAELLQKYPTINVLELIDDGVVTHVYPMEGYEEILGFDLYQNERIKREISLAAESESIYLAGPSNLVENKLGVIGLLPYYVDGEMIRTSAVIMYLEDFLDQAQLSNFTNRYRFELSKLNLATGQKDFFLGGIRDIDQKSIPSIEIKEGDWVLYAENINQDEGELFILFFVGFSLIAAFIAGYISFQILSKPIELERLLQERTQEVLESREQFKQNSELLGSVLASPQNIVIYSLDTKLRYIAYNNNYSVLINEFFGVEVQQGSSIIDIYPSKMIDEVQGNLRKTLQGVSFNYEQKIVDPKNRISYWENWYSPIKDKEGSILGVTVFSVDITERINAEKEKTTLLSEIHHRVKNNLAIVSGLLQLQKVEVDDERLSSIFDQSINRIISIALVHELMYNNDDLSSVDIHAYLEKLIPAISATMQNKAQNVHFHLDIEEYQLNINEAIPLGLLLNELITNSFKYAFDGSNNNSITVILNAINDRIHVTYSENGKGFPEGVDFNTPKNLGLNLVHAQLSQLEADHTVNTKDCFELAFSFISHGKGSHSNFEG